MKTVAQLVAEFLDPANEQMRCDILRNHDAGLVAHGLTTDQADLLGQMQSGPILAQMIEELTNNVGTSDPINQAALVDLIADLEAKRVEVFGSASTTILNLDGGVQYTSSGVHIFGVSPDTVRMSVPVSLVIRGNGYEHNVGTGSYPIVQFVPFDEPATSSLAVAGFVTGVSCDADLNERVTVQVTFPSAGRWRALIKNVDDPDWAGDVEGKNLIRVLQF